MPRREMVTNSIWDNDLAEVSALAKLVYIWSFTNPACGMAGVYPMPRRRIAAALDIETKEAEDALVELAEAGLIWEDGKWIWIIDRIDGIATRSQQIATAIYKDLAALPDGHPLVELVVNRYADQEWLPELQVRFGRGSGEVQKTASVSQSLTLTRGSPEPPLVSVLVTDLVNDDLAKLLDELRQVWPAERTYPSDHNRQEDALLAARRADDLPDDLTAAARAYLGARGWKSGNVTGCPNLSTWIADRRWTEPPPESAQAAADGLDAYDAGIAS